MTDDDAKFRAAQFGIAHAFQVAIRAIVVTNPDPDALVRAFAKEHQESMSILLASACPDVVLEAYKDCLRGCAPNPDDWLEP